MLLRLRPVLHRHRHRGLGAGRAQAQACGPPQGDGCDELDFSPKTLHASSASPFSKTLVRQLVLCIKPEFNGQIWRARWRELAEIQLRPRSTCVRVCMKKFNAFLVNRIFKNVITGSTVTVNTDPIQTTECSSSSFLNFSK